MKLILNIIIILLLVSCFIMLSFTTNKLGLWYHDSGKYFEQGYDITGRWPPVYPIILKFVGREIVGLQTVVAIISWCFLGYVLAGLPGMVLGGFFSLCPWFCRWNGLCLTESLSHSFLAFSIGFTMLLIKSQKFYIPWVISLFLFTFTRVPNVFCVPFFAFPAIFIHKKLKIILTITILTLGGMVMIHNFQPSHSSLSRKSLSYLSFETYRESISYMFNSTARPYFHNKFMEDYDAYVPKMSAFSEELKWVKFPKYAYLWLPLLVLALFKRRYLAILIPILFLMSFSQCMLNSIYNSIQNGHAEIFRHLAIADHCYAFSLIAGIGLLRRKNDNKKTN